MLVMIDTLVMNTKEEVDEMINKGASKAQILSFLALAGERVAGDGCVCSILVLDERGLLRNGASPKLPVDYLKAIDKLKPDVNLGTCAAAAATGEVVITTDFLEDKKWAELRHLPLALGFQSAWSMPIKNNKGYVTGTFGTYFTNKRQPTEKEINAIARLAEAAAKVL